MIQLETDRLLLFPLTPPQLRLWTQDLPALERELGCAYRGEPLEGHFREAVLGQLEAAEADPDQYPYRSFWFLVRKTDRVIIGAADFKGPPDQNGEVEIGYGLAKEFRRQGYMTEAVKAICTWARKQPGVAHITAETDLMGLASQRILERLGFQKYREEETLWWRL